MQVFVALFKVADQLGLPGRFVLSLFQCFGLFLGLLIESMGNLGQLNFKLFLPGDFSIELDCRLSEATLLLPELGDQLLSLFINLRNLVRQSLRLSLFILKLILHCDPLLGLLL